MRGGPREGAGRPKSENNKIAKGFRLTPETIKRLSNLADCISTSQAEIVENSIAAFDEGYGEGYHYFWADSINNLVHIDCSHPDFNVDVPHYTSIENVYSALSAEHLAEVGPVVFSVCQGLLIYLGEKYGFDDQTEAGGAGLNDVQTEFGYKAKMPAKTSDLVTIEEINKIIDLALFVKKEHNFTLDQALKIIDLAIIQKGISGDLYKRLTRYCINNHCDNL